MALIPSDKELLQEFNGRVSADNLSNEAVTTPKIADESVTTGKLASEAVTTAKIDDDAVTAAKIENQEAWHEIGAGGEPAFQNSWVNYSASDSSAAFMKDSLGFVHLKGVIKNGTGATMFTLPAGYRPLKILSFGTFSSPAAATQVALMTNGNLDGIVYNNTYLCLDGIVYRAEQ